jgi:hypothetical protein
MQFHRKQGVSVRPSTRIIVTLFVITCAVPIIGKFYTAHSQPSHRAATNSNDGQPKTSQPLTASGHWLVHAKVPEKPGGSLKASRKPPTGSIHEPEATIRGVAGQ